jgi:hypothetical protein
MGMDTIVLKPVECVYEIVDGIRVNYKSLRSPWGDYFMSFTYTIDTNGVPTDIRLIADSSSIDAPAVRLTLESAIKSWRYGPADCIKMPVKLTVQSTNIYSTRAPVRILYDSTALLGRCVGVVPKIGTLHRIYGYK